MQGTYSASDQESGSWSIHTNLLSEEQSSSEPGSEATGGTDHMKISSVNASWYHSS